MTLTLGILGGGRAAWAFGSAWKQIGWPIDGAWLRAESRSKLPELLGVPRKEIAGIDADLLLIAVSDRAIDDVASLIPNDTHSIIFHASGSMPSVRGGFSLHPLRALPPVGAPSGIGGALLVFEGNHRGVAERIAREAGARFAEIAAEAKARYHAGAVFGANYVAALLDIGEELIGVAGARGDLAALAHSAVDNWAAHDDARRFTGPAARNDLPTIERHLVALANRPELAEIYRLLAARILAARD